MTFSLVVVAAGMAALSAAVVLGAALVAGWVAGSVALGGVGVALIAAGLLIDFERGN